MASQRLPSATPPDGCAARLYGPCRDTPSRSRERAWERGPRSGSQNRVVRARGAQRSINGGGVVGLRRSAGARVARMPHNLCNTLMITRVAIFNYGFISRL